MHTTTPKILDPVNGCYGCGAVQGAPHGKCCPQAPFSGSGGTYGTPLPTTTTITHPALPTDAQARKNLPVFTGAVMYFPNALLEVARVSKIGNDQHNPGEPLHWARGKSTDQMDTAMRHMMDHGMGNVKDTDGGYHLAKAAWRILAELQLTIEKEAK